MARTRKRSPPPGSSRYRGGRSEGAVSAEAATSNLVNITDIDFPGSIDQGVSFQGSVEINNSALIIRAVDEDYCTGGPFGGPREHGYDLTITVFVNGSAVAERQVCFSAQDRGWIDIEMPGFDTAGEQAVEIVVVGSNSGNEVATEETIITSNPVGDGGDGGDGGTGGDDGDDGDNGDGGGGDQPDEDRGFSLTGWWTGLNSTEKALVGVGVIGGALAISSQDGDSTSRRRSG